MARTTRSKSQRAGATSVAALFVLPLLLLIVGLAVYVAQMRDARTEVQHGADAAALSAARALACDDLLVADPIREGARRNRAREAADHLAGANFAQGQQLKIRPNPENKADGDIVFGRHDGTFDALAAGADRATAVQVTLAGPQVRDLLGGTRFSRNAPARATGKLDFAVTGFRPLDGRAPVVPLALFTDHTGTNASGWDAQLAAARDEWRLDEKGWSGGSDGIPEVVVVVGRPHTVGEVPAAFVRLGTEGPGETIAQVGVGVDREQCEKLTGGLVLREHNTLTVTGSHECPSEADPARAPLLAAFGAIVGEARAWPLYSDADRDAGTIRVTGWVGARVVSVTSSRGGVRIVLQPAVIHHPSVVTDSGRTDRPTFWTTNRTVCRVRLAE